MRQAVLTFALVALLVAPAVASAAIGPAAPIQSSAQSASIAPDRTGLTVAIHLQADGDARWNISIRYALSGENETEAFESLLADYRRGADVGPSVDVFRTVAARQSDRLGRAMAIRKVERDGYLNRSGNATGVLALSFTWTNFSVVREDDIRIADVFDGGWFGRLRANEELLVYPPEGYALDTATPQTRVVDGALQWSGPQSFEDGPAMTFEQAPTNAGIPWMLIGGAIVVALLAGGVIVFLWNRHTEPGTPAPASEGRQREREAAPEAPAESEESGEPGGSETEAEAGVEEAEEAAGAAGATETEEEESEELLSDEERVERILREHGGRMKQAKIVEETRWSNAKVSQLLSSMAEEDRVEKLRIGRENLISLPEENRES